MCAEFPIRWMAGLSPFRLRIWEKKELVENKQERLARVTDKLQDWSDEECQRFGQLLRKFNRTFK